MASPLLDRLRPRPFAVAGSRRTSDRRAGDGGGDPFSPLTRRGRLTYPWLLDRSRALLVIDLATSDDEEQGRWSGSSSSPSTRGSAGERAYGAWSGSRTSVRPTTGRRVATPWSYPWSRARTAMRPGIRTRGRIDGDRSRMGPRTRSHADCIRGGAGGARPTGRCALPPRGHIGPRSERIGGRISYRRPSGENECGRTCDHGRSTGWLRSLD